MMFIQLVATFLGVFSVSTYGFHVTKSMNSYVTATALQSEKGAGFKYDPANYQDSNSGNYRRLSDQLAAVKAEEEQLLKEREEIMRKESMKKMILKQENDTFWNTPDDKLMATADKFFIPPEVLQIIDDLDNQLIGLKPVRLSLAIINAFTNCKILIRIF